MDTLLDKIIKKKLDFLFLISISFILIFWNLSSISLWSPDEPRFAAIVKAMIDTGDYIVPRLNGNPLPWKPILVYWLMAVPAWIAGEVSSLTSRLPSAASALLILSFFYWFIKRFAGRKEALLSCLILILNYTFLEQARAAIIDMTLTLFIVGSLICFYSGYTDKKKQNLFYNLVFVSCAFAMLTKGPVGVITPACVVFVFLAWEKNLAHVRTFLTVKRVLFFILIVVPWFTAACFIGGKNYADGGVSGYAYELIIRQNFIRFFNAFDHIQPFTYYIDRILSHFFPWSLLLPGALVLFFKDYKKYKNTPDEKPAFRRFIGSWTLSVFLFYSLSKSKRSQYILSLYPALSFLVAYLALHFGKAKEKQDIGISLSWIKGPLGMMCLVLGISFMAFPSFVKYANHFSKDYFSESIAWGSVIVLLTLFTGSALSGISSWKKIKAVFPRFLLLSFSLYLFMVASLHPQLDRIKTAIPYAKKINEAVGKDRFITFYFDRPEFVFYLDRGPFEVLKEDDVGKLMQILKRKEKVYCLIMRRYYEDRLPYLSQVRHKIVLDDLKGWKWDLLLISN